MRKVRNEMITAPVRRYGTANAPRRNRAPPPTSYDDFQVDSIADRVLSYGDFDLVTVQNADGVSAELQERRNEASYDMDYARAHEAEVAIRNLAAVKTQRDLAWADQTHTEEMGNRLAEVRTGADKLRDHMCNTERQMCSDRDAALARVRQKNESELAAFDARTRNGELPAKFRKMSPAYLQLRQQQRALAANREFEQAKTVKEEADAVERMEWQNNCARFQAKVDAERAEMVKKHHRRIETSTRHWNAKVEAMQKRVGHDLSLTERAANRLEEKIGAKDRFAAEAGWCETPRNSTGRGREDLNATSTQLLFRQRALINRKSSARLAVPGSCRTAKTAR